MAAIIKSGAVGAYVGSSGSTVTFDITNCAVDDWIVLFQGVDWSFPSGAANPLPNISGTGITWTARTVQFPDTNNRGFNVVWTGRVTSAGTRSVTVASGSRDATVNANWVHLDAGWTFHAAATTNTQAAATSANSSSLPVCVSGDYYFAAWQAEYQGTTDWVLPASFTGAGHANQGDGVQSSGYEALSASGASGTRTATRSTSNPWCASSVVLRPAATGPAAPTVNAGADVTNHPVNTAFSRTATEQTNGATITSRAWTIVSGPTGVGSTLATAAALSWTPTVTGSYVLRYSATNAEGTGTDEMAISVITPPSTTAVLWAGQVAATTNTTWANTALALGSTTGDFATFTSGSNGAVGTIRLAGYNVQATIGTQPASVDQVAVTVKSYVDNLSRWTALEAQLYSGATALGSAQALTLSTSAGNEQTVTFTGRSWADLADLHVRVAVTRGSGGSSTYRVDRVGVAVTYTPSAGPAAPTVDAGADVTGHEVDTAFARTATENDGGSAITARAWSIVAGPAGVGSTIGTAAALSWTPTVTGSYTLRYSATNAEGTGSDDVTVGVVDPAAGTLLWEGLAEEAPDWLAKFDALNPPDLQSPQTRAFVTAPTRAGTYAYEFAVNGVAGDGSQRAESVPNLRYLTEGENLWFGMAVYLPTGFPTGVSVNDWQIFYQWRHGGSGGGSPPLSVEVMGGNFLLTGGGGPNGEPLMPQQVLGTATTGQWHDLLFNILFDTDPAVGSVSAWLDGTQVLNQYKPPGGTMYVESTVRSFVKLGMYRAGYLDPAAATVHLDELRVATSRSLAEVPASGSAALTVRAARASSRTTRPLLGQGTALAVDPARAVSRAAAATLAQSSAVTVPAARAATRASTPLLGQGHGLVVDDTRSGSRTAVVPLGQHHGLLAPAAARAVSRTSAPALAQHHPLTAAAARATTSAGTALLGQAQPLTAAAARAATRAGRPSLAPTIALAVPPARAAARTSTPRLGQTQPLTTTAARSTPQTHPAALTQHSTGLAVTAARAQSRAMPAEVGQTHPLTVAAARTAPTTGQAALTHTHPLAVTPARAPARVSSPTLLGVGAIGVRRARATTAATRPLLTQHIGAPTITAARSHSTTAAPRLTQHAPLGVRAARATAVAGLARPGQDHPLTVGPARATSRTAQVLLLGVGTVAARPARANSRTTSPLLAQHSTLAVAPARAVTAATRPPLARIDPLRLSAARATTRAPRVAVDQLVLLTVAAARAPARASRPVLPGAWRPQTPPGRILTAGPHQRIVQASADTARLMWATPEDRDTPSGPAAP